MTLLKTPMHPGEVLKTLYLEPLEMSAISLAKSLGVPRTRIERLVKGQTGVSTDTALRLARFFSTSPEYWLNLQRNWELHQAMQTTDTSSITPLETA